MGVSFLCVRDSIYIDSIKKSGAAAAKKAYL